MKTANIVVLGSNFGGAAAATEIDRIEKEEIILKDGRKLPYRGRC